MSLKYISLFAGVGGIDAAMDAAGCECVLQAERDPQALSVLRRHWPNVKKVDDVRLVRPGIIDGRVDAIVGGFPCQDLSVAGRRAGLGGEKSGLWWEFHRIIREFSPAWVLIENVFGLFSSWTGTTDPPSGIPTLENRRGVVLDETSDFDTVTRSLSDLGYGWAARGLDAQWFNVPQQRERVFIVGRAGGDVRRAAEVLFERDSLPWDSPPSRETGQRTAATLTAGVASGRGVSRPGRRREDDVNIVGTFITVEPHAAERVSDGVGFDASEDGTGRGTPLVPIAFQSKQSSTSQGPSFDDLCPTFDVAKSGGASVAVPIAFTANQHDEVRDLGDMAATLKAEAGAGRQTYLAYQCQGSNVGEMGTLRKGDGGVTSGVPFIAEERPPLPDVSVSAMSGSGGQRQDKQPRTVTPYGVRRLLPIECEACQGMQPEHTRWGINAKGETVELSDSARYRLIGNSVAVPVVFWLAKRIVAAHEVEQPPRAL